MWFWFAFALAALIGEVLSGTFYLLLIALGLAAGGLAAWVGAGLGLQIVVAAVVAILGLLVLRKTHVLKKREVNAARNKDVNLDIGGHVSIAAWGADDTAHVRYRGALWSARLAPGFSPVSGRHRIIEIEGSTLVVVPDDGA